MTVAIAFGLVIAASASTGIGAAVVFFPSIVKLASRRVLASSLGFSAGVMCYVSFIEIFGKSRTAFENAGLEEGKAYAYATLCFFSGVGIMMLLNLIVSWLLGGHGHHHDATGTPHDIDNKDQGHKHKTTRKDLNESTTELGFQPPCCVKDPIEQLNTFHRMASVIQHEMSEGEDDNDDADVDVDADIEENLDLDNDIEDDFMDNLPLQDGKVEDPTAPATEGSGEADQKTTEENKRLVKMGMNTAIAIGLHNFPEGLATFVAAVDDPKVGSVLAVAIAIHNIPEGLCVALPIFYATGKRMNAFLWALLSGASEIIAAVLGWLILSSLFSQQVYGALFGIVAGMMVIISVRELIPTAHFYDPEDTVVTNSFIAGMAVIALSLVLFFL
mmetsp:Transcript_17476/g.49902  ORF Transcript_17476/g.49902 Transcript_17476/m.49902 type:complete len:387 (+) Transcript_17476:184-1344(+)